MEEKQIERVVALTGGTRGIGYKTVKALLDRGYKIAIFYESSKM